MQPSKRSPRARTQSSSLAVPFTAGPSSSPVIRKEIEPREVPWRATWARAAATAAAMPPFMSQAPRPCTIPSATVPAKGGKRQAAASPGGTTSVWPAKAMWGVPVPMRA